MTKCPGRCVNTPGAGHEETPLMPTRDPTSPDPKVIRLRNNTLELNKATLSVEYALANLPDGHPARLEWGRIAHAMVVWSHDMRDDLEEHG